LASEHLDSMRALANEYCYIIAASLLYVKSDDT